MQFIDIVINYGYLDSRSANIIGNICLTEMTCNFTNQYMIKLMVKLISKYKR